MINLNKNKGKKNKEKIMEYEMDSSNTITGPKQNLDPS